MTNSMECPACGEITLEKTGEVNAPIPFNEYECPCGHYETDAPIMLKRQAE